jgi:hypothetical protein
MWRIILLMTILSLANCSDNDWRRLDFEGPVYPHEWKEYCEEHPESTDWHCDRYRKNDQEVGVTPGRDFDKKPHPKSTPNGK